MNFYVTDTHALFWYLTASPRLGLAAKAAFDEAANGNAQIFISVIVLAELYYLNRKLGQPLDFAATYSQFQKGSQYVLLSFLPDEILDFDVDQAVPEMHDRIIAGLSRRLGAYCLTVDVSIVNSGLVKIVW